MSYEPVDQPVEYDLPEIVRWVMMIQWLINENMLSYPGGGAVGTGEVTLTVSSPQTVVNDDDATVGSSVFFSATTLNAAQEVPRVVSVADGSFTIQHANNTQTDRTYQYVVIG